MEGYVQREDPHGLPAETYTVLRQVARLHNMHYPPGDVGEATALYKRMSVLV